MKTELSEFDHLISHQLYLWNLGFLKDFIKGLKEYLPEEVYEYYVKLIEYQMKYRFQRQGLMALYKKETLNYNILRNMYANTIRDFEITKELLKEAQIHFYFDDARIVPKNLKGNYDMIYLSNISDHLGSESKELTLNGFEAYLKRYYDLLSRNGVLVNYLFGMNQDQIIQNSSISKYDLESSNLHFIDQTNGYYLVRKK